MTRLLTVLFLAAGLASCDKDNVGSGQELLGSWVDINHTADTLVFFKRDGKIILQDNSLTFRTARQNNPGLDLWTTQYVVRLAEGHLLTRPVNATDDVEFFKGKFQWLNGKTMFSVEPNGFRMYLSCMGCPQQFRKI